ncbi:hypothetical protein BKA62DRAFT_728163 [Auriculariales sp. MPI-PUGE-AT-0066]|nr:hypothetical protein BKA62DRAFT_728163 [Auriculariales sp. MPI-PUGE-AT-0066]
MDENLSTSSRPLPLDLLCDIVQISACMYRDSAMQWAATLALLSRTTLNTVRSALYELYVVGRSLRHDDLYSKSYVQAHPSVREFLAMLANDGDDRRKYIRCLIFAHCPIELLPGVYNGSGWIINKVVYASHCLNSTVKEIPSIQIQARCLIACCWNQPRGTEDVIGHSFRLAFDVDLASAGQISDGIVPFEQFPLEHTDEAESISWIFYAVTNRSMVAIFSPGPKALQLGAVAVDNERSRFFARCVETGSYEKIPEDARMKIRWSTRDWNRALVCHPEYYRDLLCGSDRWDIGVPLDAAIETKVKRAECQLHKVYSAH